MAGRVRQKVKLKTFGGKGVVTVFGTRDKTGHSSNAGTSKPPS